MGFVHIGQADDAIDYVNVDHVARVLVDSPGPDQFVVLVVLSNGERLVDSRHQSREAARVRVVSLVSSS
jgi:hypothetical protein